MTFSNTCKTKNINSVLCPRVRSSETILLPIEVSGQISRKSAILIFSYYPTNERTFVFLCFENPLVPLIFGTKCPISMGLSAKCSVINVLNKEVATNRNLRTADFTLILLDRITYHGVYLICINLHMSKKFKRKQQVVDYL